MRDNNKVRALVRGLEVLEMINRANGASVRDVARGTGLNRGTVYRLLETMREAGFLEKRPNSIGYWLSTRVPGLSAGYRSDAWVSQMAEPALEKLTAKFDWPCSLLIPLDTRMVVLAHTEHLSPMTFKVRDLGLTMSVFDTSSGLTYLAFASSATQTALIESARTDVKGKKVAAVLLRRTLEQIRAQGHHIVDSPDRGSVLSVPILVGGAAFGVLALRYFTSAMTHGAAVRKYAAALKEAALTLGKDLEKLEGARRPKLRG
jgi:IclR family mhp operon transcriptional activator